MAYLLPSHLLPGDRAEQHHKWLEHVEPESREVRRESGRGFRVYLCKQIMIQRSSQFCFLIMTPNFWASSGSYPTFSSTENHPAAGNGGNTDRDLILMQRPDIAGYESATWSWREIWPLLFRHRHPGVKWYQSYKIRLWYFEVVTVLQPMKCRYWGQLHKS